MNKLLFVSTGRCGTVRLTQILREKLPEEKYAVVHQMKYSRLANVIGNFLYYVNGFEQMKEKLYSAIVAPYHRDRHFVCTDPLTSMIISQNTIEEKNTYIVHLQRDHDAFARSMVALTRNRLRSRIAHNLIPLWQPGILPLENQLSTKMLSRYQMVSIKKNLYFAEKFGHSPNYFNIDMQELFCADHLAKLIKSTIGETIEVTQADLQRKVNESLPESKSKPFDDKKI